MKLSLHKIIRNFIFLFSIIILSACASTDYKRGPAGAQSSSEICKSNLLPFDLLSKNQKAVFIDIKNARYNLFIDFDNKKVAVEAELIINTKTAGHPLLDLIPEANIVTVDGEGTQLVEVQLPCKSSRMKYLDRVVGAGEHKIFVKYEFDYPRIYKPGNIVTNQGSSENELFFNFSDLNDRGYLERFLPANLESDSYPFDLNITFNKEREDFHIISNGELVRDEKTEMRFKFPEFSNSSSMFLNIVPKNDYKFEQTEFYSLVSKKKISLTIYLPSKDLNSANEKLPEEFKREVNISLKKAEEIFGKFPGDKLIVKGKASGSGGMEYAMATETAKAAIQHEIFHSYFGRGIKNTNSNSAWLDEATVVWLEEYIKGNNNITDNDKNKKLEEKGAPLYLISTNLSTKSPYHRNSNNRAYNYGANFMSYLNFVISQDNSSIGLIDVLKRLVKTRMHQYWDNSIFLDALKTETGMDFKDDFDFFVGGTALDEVDHEKIFVNVKAYEAANLHKLAKITNPQGSTTKLHLAASGNSVRAFEFFLEEKPEDLTKKDKYGRSVFTYALTGGNPEIIRKLRSLGFKNEDGPKGDALKFVEKASLWDIETSKALKEALLK